jgi:hypothetical protein
VPDEILDAGRVELTAMVHPVLSTRWVWSWTQGNTPWLQEISLKWPPETGGAETVRKIIRVLEENPKEEFCELYGEPVIGFNSEIHRLANPERQRLRKLMEEATHKVVSLIGASSAL